MPGLKPRGAQEEIDVLEAVKARVQKRGLTPDATSTPFSFDVLMEQIMRRDAAFLDRFAKEIQSGDHLRIRKALRAAHDLISDLWTSQGVGLLGDSMPELKNFSMQGIAIFIANFVYSNSAVWEDRFIFGWFSG